MKVHLQVTAGPDLGRTFTFDARDRFLIGRAPGTHLQIADDPFFSRHHAMLEIDPPNVRIQDLKSTNGTYVNGARIAAPTALHHADAIGGGGTRLAVAIEDDAPPAPAPVVATAPTALGTIAVAPRAAAAPATARSLVSALVARTTQRVDDTEHLAVRCLRCGAVAPNEAPRPRGDQVAYYCDACKQGLLVSPELVRGYRTVRELGRGAMGAVYLAVEEATGTQRALKMILPRAALAQRARDLFVREASTQGSLAHPNVVQMIALEEVTKGIFVMVMEFVDGKNAEQLVEPTPDGLDPRFAATIVAQALDGVAHAHSRGIVHRDIKDANLLVGYDAAGQLAVKLSDFGLAKSYETSGASGFTRTGEFGGTMFYMAPEQILDYRNVRPAADLYAMGATLYHLLTKRWVYELVDQDPLVAILEDPITPIAARRAGVPPAIAAVAERALCKDPAARWPSATAMRDALLAARR